MSNKLLTIDEAAQYLDIHPGTLYRWVRARQVPAVKIGKIWRFREKILEDWFDKKAANLFDAKREEAAVLQPRTSLDMGSVLTLEGIKTSLRARIKKYQRRAREIEEYLSGRPNEWVKFQEEFTATVNNVFRQIMEFEKENIAAGHPEKVQKLKKIFRKRLRIIFVRGVYGPWSLNKPLGYAGDYKIIDDIYQNNPATSGFDRLFDNYFQTSAISVAVRNRKEDFKRIIIKFIEDKRDKNIRIMNLASGSCREIKEIFCLNNLTNKDIIFDCYDHEEKAIEFAKTLLGDLSNIHLIKEDILRICLMKDITEKIKQKYDLIYATGFFDYFKNKTCIHLIKNLRRLLNDGGTIAISNVRDKYSNPSVHYMEWCGEWDLVYRSEEEFKKIFIEGGFKEEQLKIQYEQQGIMQYILVTN